MARVPGDHPLLPARTQVVSNRSGFPNMFMVEVGRGCGRGCRFCAAGFVHRPPLTLEPAAVEEALDQAPPWASVGLVGLEFLGARGLETLFQGLLAAGRRLSFSSLRADGVTPLFARLLVESGQRQATLAPEAGSQRLRDVINKGLTQEQILSAAERLVGAGIPDLKLYFMLGLPTEEDGDVEEVAALVRRVREVLVKAGRERGRLGRLVVSVSTFVPKPWTPFQWGAQADKKILQRRRRILKDLVGPLDNVVLRLDSLREARLQAVLARGGMELGPLLASLGEGRGDLLRAMEGAGLRPRDYLGPRPVEGELPWEVVGHGVERGYLLAEARRGLEERRQSPPCRVGRCRRCGACGHE